MSSVRWGVPWEERLFDKAWPAALSVIVLYQKLQRLWATLSAGDSADRTGLALAADVSHQLVSILVFATIVVLFIIRRAPLGPRSNLLGAAVALAGTTALGLFTVVAPPPSTHPVVLAASAALALSGVALTVVSLLTLGRCFGLFPEARGLVTWGPYRYVRHPVYLGEFISGFGLLLPLLAPWTALVFLLFVALQVWRMFNEERALEAVFPEYAEYRRRTWRVVPGVF